MNDIAISIEGLGKAYRIRHEARERYKSLRDVIAERARRLVRGSSAPADGRTVEDYWALRDVTFDVTRGEVLGIIGRNGAGKSTLLKLLSRITEPSAGRIELSGRVATLLEVGTGFHPELTGRENIYLNGAILGMRRAEINEKFDEIVAFAEIEKFLDTPVKRYSSGMYVRLAFAVAAHLNPDILIMDEVLAVGDAEFQKRCIGKMGDAAKSGKTVLFVSHQLGIVRETCDRCVLLVSGQVEKIGDPDEVVGHYLRAGAGAALQTSARYLRAVYGADGVARPNVFFGDPLRVRIELRNLPEQPYGVNVSIRSRSGRLACLFSTNPHDGFTLPRRDDLVLEFTMDPCCLAPGEYSIDVAVTEPAICILEQVDGVMEFEVQPQRVGGIWAYEARYGDFFPPHRWAVVEPVHRG